MFKEKLTHLYGVPVYPTIWTVYLREGKSLHLSASRDEVQAQAEKDNNYGIEIHVVRC